MMQFFYMLWGFIGGIIDELNAAVFRFGDGVNDVTSIGSVIFAALVIGFVVSMFWKGAKSQ